MYLTPSMCVAGHVMMRKVKTYRLSSQALEAWGCLPCHSLPCLPVMVNARRATAHMPHLGYEAFLTSESLCGEVAFLARVHAVSCAPGSTPTCG